jgi:drug/metabolite transporter (DMT)-like permease
VLATALAIVLLGERPTPLALLGAGLVAAGAFGLTLGGRTPEGGGARAAVVYGLLTGTLIAVYTLWDKWGVGGLLLPPLLFYWMSNAGRVLLLTPLAARRRDQVRAEWRTHRREVLGVALLSPLSYILMLTALATSPVSYVAPAREIGILFGTLLGTHLLDEGHALRRVSAACLMVLGVIALAVG